MDRLRADLDGLDSERDEFAATCGDEFGADCPNESTGHKTRMAGLLEALSGHCDRWWHDDWDTDHHHHWGDCSGDNHRHHGGSNE